MQMTKESARRTRESQVLAAAAVLALALLLSACTRTFRTSDTWRTDEEDIARVVAEVKQKTVAGGEANGIGSRGATGAKAAAGAPAPGGDAAAELAKKLQNPIAALISLPFQFNYDSGGGATGRGDQYSFKVQPVIPFSVSKDWNAISRTIVPFNYQTDVIGSSEQTGMGDITQSFFFSPKKPGPGGLVWGAGPVILFPTATDDLLGAKKLGIGPTVVVLKQSKGWTYGALGNHIWSVTGRDSRPDISLTYLQPFLSYTTKTQTSFGLNTESTYNWKNDKWTVPVNASVTQVMKIGGQPVSLQVGGRYYATGPSGTPDWGLRCQFTLLFPK